MIEKAGMKLWKEMPEKIGNFKKQGMKYEYVCTYVDKKGHTKVSMLAGWFGGKTKTFHLDFSIPEKEIYLGKFSDQKSMQKAMLDFLGDWASVSNCPTLVKRQREVLGIGKVDKWVVVPAKLS